MPVVPPTPLPGIATEMPVLDGAALPGIPGIGSDLVDSLESRGWEPMDLSALSLDTMPTPKPELLHRSDGPGLLYAGKINMFLGRPGTGKTWIALLAVAQVIQGGRAALFLDHEDSIGTCWRRLALLGCTDEQIRERLLYVQPSMWGTPEDLARLAALTESSDIALVVVDSVGESMSMAQADQNDDPAVARWLRTLARRLTAAGPAVLLLDHLPKDSPEVGTWPIGSQRKLAGADGAVYAVSVGEYPFSATTSGKALLTVVKDRNGAMTKDEKAAEFKVTIDDNESSFELLPVVNEKRTPAGNVQRPTWLMEQVSRVLEDWPRERPTPGVNDICARVRGRKADISQAIAALVDGGWVDSSVGSRRQQILTSVAPFRAHADELSTLAGLVPSGSGNQSEPVGTSDEPTHDPPESTGSQWFPVVPGTGPESGLTGSREGPPPKAEGLGGENGNQSTQDGEILEVDGNQSSSEVGEQAQASSPASASVVESVMDAMFGPEDAP